MPPWKPVENYGPPISGARRLTDDEIELFNIGRNTASKPGIGAQEVSYESPASGWILGEPDLILELDESYVLPAEGLDIYRNFVIPLALTGRKFVRAGRISTECPACDSSRPNRH